MALRCPNPQCQDVFANVADMLGHLAIAHPEVPGVPAAYGPAAGGDLPDYNVANNLLFKPAQRTVYQNLVDIHNRNPQGCTTLVEACTGFGKGCMVTVMPGAFRSRRMLFIVPSLITKQEAIRKFMGDAGNPPFIRRVGAIPASQQHLEPGVFVPESSAAIPGNYNQALEQLRRFDVVICTAQLANKLLPRFRELSHLHQQQTDRPLFDLIVFDEGHHGPANTWQRIKDNLGGITWDENGAMRRPHVVYLTGTPYRLISGEDYQEETERYTLRTAIAEETAKDVVLLNVIAPPVPTVEDRVRQAGRIIAHLLKNKRALSGNTIPHKALVMVKGRFCAADYARIINEARMELHSLPGGPGGGGTVFLRAESIHGAEGDAVRAEKMRRFESRQVFNPDCVDVLFQHGVLGEGYDHPFISVAVVMRKCNKVATLGQFLGRAVRKLDHHNVGDGVEVRPEDNVCHMLTLQCYEQVQLFADYVRQNPERVTDATDGDNSTQGGGEEEEEDDVPPPMAPQSPVEAEVHIRRYFFPVDDAAHMLALQQREDRLHFTNPRNWLVETIPIDG